MMKNYPKYYKRELCCLNVNYIKRFSDTQADYLQTHDGVAKHKSLVTYANVEEADARLGGYMECEAEEYENLKI